MTRSTPKKTKDEYIGDILKWAKNLNIFEKRLNPPNNQTLVVSLFKIPEFGPYQVNALWHKGFKYGYEMQVMLPINDEQTIIDLMDLKEGLMNRLKLELYKIACDFNFYLLEILLLHLVFYQA